MSAFPVIFGKHPAWPDFMEDGLPASGPLRQWCDALMTSIERAVTAGRWSAPGQAAPEWLIDFDHMLVWGASGQLAIARIWASVDARGRAHYPLIVMQPVEPDAGLDELGVALEHIERLGGAARLVTDQDAFARIREAETQRSRLAKPVTRDRATQWQQLAGSMGPSGGGAHTHAVRRALAEFEQTQAIAGQRSLTASQVASIQHLAYSLRLPAGDRPLERLGSVALLLRDALRADTHLACLTPCSGAARWVDVIVGLPTPESVVSIRMDASEAPPVDVAPPTLGERAHAVLSAWSEGARFASRPPSLGATTAGKAASQGDADARSGSRGGARSGPTLSDGAGGGDRSRLLGPKGVAIILLAAVVFVLAVLWLI